LTNLNSTILDKLEIQVSHIDSAEKINECQKRIFTETDLVKYSLRGLKDFEGTSCRDYKGKGP